MPGGQQWSNNRKMVAKQSLARRQLLAALGRAPGRRWGGARRGRGRHWRSAGRSLHTGEVELGRCQRAALPGDGDGAGCLACSLSCERLR